MLMRGLLITGAAIAALTLGLAACSKKADDQGAATPGAAAPAAGAPAAVTPAKLPHPVPGKWKVTPSMEGVSVAMPATEVCYTPEMVENSNWADNQRPSDMDCDPPVTSAVAGGVKIHNVCRYQGRTMTTDMTATGDFSKAYVVEMSTSTDPAPAGMPQPMRMKMSAQRVGDC